MKFFSLLIGLLIGFVAYPQKTPADTLVTQTIIYKTNKAGEIYLLWAVDNWKGPADQKYLPENTFIKKKMAWSKMAKDSNQFTLKLSLPRNTTMNFLFWVPIDKNRDSTDGWDTFGDINYSSFFSENRTVVLNDHALYMPGEHVAVYGLTIAKYVLYLLVLVCIVLMILFRKRWSFSTTGFLAGMVLGTAILMLLVRMYMNQLFAHPLKVFGAAFEDLVWLSLVSGFFLFLLYVTQQKKWLQYIVFTVFLLITFVFGLVSIVNIVIVKYLGRPLTYQWLYYADFMRGSEAKNVVAQNLSPQLIISIVSLLIPILLLATGFAIVSAQTLKKTNKILVFVLAIFLITGLIQARAVSYDYGKIRNPFMELISSAVSAGRNPGLYSMKVSGENTTYMEQFHQAVTTTRPDSASFINNIILFVMESTPKEFVSMYDSNITVTPNLRKYKSMSTAFTNMYAHIPSTPNSMLSLVNGIYPLMTYKSFLNEYTYSNLPTLPAGLKEKGWQTSFFSSSNLEFSNMKSFAQKSGFQTVEDNRVISCSLQAFHTTNTVLDGMNDQCIVNRYFQWVDKNESRPKYSMMWTNQTHYPYFFYQDKEDRYVSNKDLNHYLNALKSTDEAFGNLMKGLEERGMLKNTMVIVLGDHGEAFGTHNQSTHASFIYEENVHIPCIVYSPLLCRGDTSNRIGQLVDIVPTIACLAGLSNAPEWEGRNLFSPVPRDRAFFFTPYSDLLFGSRSGKWKYIYNVLNSKDELYDLDDDPKELKNVSSQHSEITKREHELVAAWIQYHQARIQKWERDKRIR